MGIKVTTIYELEKQATPGPWIPIHGKGTCFHGGNEDSVQSMTLAGDGEEIWETVAELWPTAPKGTATCDAKLIAHCRNHFMEALEALKTVEAQFAGYAMRIAPADEGNDIILGDLERAIKKLEAVS